MTGTASHFTTLRESRSFRYGQFSESEAHAPEGAALVGAVPSEAKFLGKLRNCSRDLRIFYQINMIRLVSYVIYRPPCYFRFRSIRRTQ